MEKRTRLFRELSAEGQGQAEPEPHSEKNSRTEGRDGVTEEDQEGTQGTRRSGPASGREGCGENGAQAMIPGDAK